MCRTFFVNINIALYTNWTAGSMQVLFSMKKINATHGIEYLFDQACVGSGKMSGSST